MQLKWRIWALCLGFGQGHLAQGSDLNATFQAVSKRKADLVYESVDRRVKAVLLFHSDPAMLRMQSALLRELGQGVEYFVVHPDQGPARVSAKELVAIQKGASIRLISYGHCFTPWVQDFFLRLTIDKGLGFAVEPTFSQSLQMNECKPFELGIADALMRADSRFQSLGSTEAGSEVGSERGGEVYNFHRVDRKNGEIYGDSPALAKLFPIRTLRSISGEGGMRIPTRSMIFFERTDWQAMAKKINSVNSALASAQLNSWFQETFGKRVIPVGSRLNANEFYGFHIDMFLTPVERKDGSKFVLMGHPRATESLVSQDQLRGLPGFDSDSWAKKIQQADLIEQELQGNGLAVIRMPILFLNSKQGSLTITFNNALQSLDAEGRPTIWVPQYRIPEMAGVLIRMEQRWIQVAKERSLHLRFIEGGEQLLHLNGQLRCSTGVLGYQN